MGTPSKIELSEEQVADIDSRLARNELTAEDREILGRVLKAMLWMSEQLELGRLGMAKLR